MGEIFVPDPYIAQVVPYGPGGIDLFVLSIFTWALLVFANIYYGQAHRALDMTLESLKTKTSITLTRFMAYHPEVQNRVTEMVMEMESIGPHR